MTQLAVLSAIGGNRGVVLGLTSNYCDIIYWLPILLLFEAIVADMSRLGCGNSQEVAACLKKKGGSKF